MNPVGDEHFATVEPPAVAIASRGGANTLPIGVGIGLGHRYRGDGLTRYDPGQVTSALLFAARIEEMGRGDVGVYRSRHSYPAVSTPGQRLRDHHRRDRVHSAARVQHDLF